MCIKMKKGYQLLDMTRNVLLITTMCCLASGILFPGRASAMLPVGNDAHRQFYREQEWIWSAPEHPARFSSSDNARRNARQKPPSSLSDTVADRADLAVHRQSGVHGADPPQANLAFTVPTRPPQANLAFTVPSVPPQANLAFTVPTAAPS